MAKSVLKCNAISQITPWVSISNKFLQITRWPELLIGKNSVKPCIKPSIIDFNNIFTWDIGKDSDNIGRMRQVNERKVYQSLHLVSINFAQIVVKSTLHIRQ